MGSRNAHNRGATHSYGYSYDTAGRLTGVTVDGTPNSSYSYDANSNRLPGTYDDQDRMLSYGGATYTYTAAGDLATKTAFGSTTSYTYDDLGNLTHVALPNGEAIDYAIDGQNRRVGKKIDGVLVRQWLYGDALRIVAELDGSGNLISRFVYGSRANVPDYMIRQGVTYRILSDHLGSPRLIVNAADGTIAEHLDYDAFGVVIADTNPGFQPFGFAGGLYDPDTSLVRFGARDYDAGTGRWTTKEPLGFGGGTSNFYAYATNDPINLVDIDGLKVYPANFVGPLQPGDVRAFQANLSEPALAPLASPPYPGASQFYGESHECVAFTKHFAGLPCTDCWRAGPPVVGNDIPPGTAVATFDQNGRYPQTDVDKNSGLFLFPMQPGFAILDQWPTHPAQARQVHPGRPNPSNNSDAYSVITVPPGTKSNKCGCGN